jgi:hypothetical protein
MEIDALSGVKRGRERSRTPGSDMYADGVKLGGPD